MGLLESFKGEMRCFAASCEVIPRVVSQFPLVTKDRNTHADTRNATKTTAGASPSSPKNKSTCQPGWFACAGVLIWSGEVAQARTSSRTRTTGPSVSTTLPVRRRCSSCIARALLQRHPVWVQPSQWEGISSLLNQSDPR